MRLKAKVVIFIDRLRRRIRAGNNRAIYRTLGLIRKEAREKMRLRSRRVQNPPPGKPPYAYTRAGLREIAFAVVGQDAGYVGPRKFARSNFFNKPVPAVHEKGGVIISYRRQRTVLARYPERSFMYSAVKRLQSKGKLNSQFRFLLRSF